ncbi:MAG: FtsX-like permease family protein [Candidatus Odinarchaeota archaeon]
MNISNQSWILAINRLKRSKANSIFTFSAIAIALTFTFGTALGARQLQVAVICSDLDSRIADINIGASFSDNTYLADFFFLESGITHLSQVDTTVIRYHTQGYSWSEGDTHYLNNHIWVDKNDSSNYLDYSHSDSGYPETLQLDIFGYNAGQFKNYCNLTSILAENSVDVLLKENMTFISHYLAQKLDLSINDTLYIHYMGWTGDHPGPAHVKANKTFPLTVGNILTIPSKSDLAKDFVEDPFIPNEKGIIDELLILETATFLKVADYLAVDYMKASASRLVISIYLDREKVLATYDQEKSPLLLENIEENILGTLRGILPGGTVFYTDSILLTELKKREGDINHLQQTLLFISIPVIILLFLIALFIRTVAIDNQIREYRILVCRFMPEKAIRNSFLIEGMITGFIAAISSIFTSISLVSLLYFVIPIGGNFIGWELVSNSVFLSLAVNTVLVGLLMGVGINYFASRKILDIYPADILLENRDITEWFDKKRRNVKLIVLFLVFTATNWIVIQILSLAGFTEIFKDLSLLLGGISSGLLLLLPLVIVLLLLVLVINRRDIFTGYIVLFSFFLNQTAKDIMRYNHLRRPKHFSHLALLTALAFSMGIMPIMLARSAEDVSIREIKTEIGSDIKITGTYEQLNVPPANFKGISTDIYEVTPVIWIDTDVVVYVNGYASALLIAVQPETFTKVMFIEDYFTPGKNAVEVFSSLKSGEATALESFRYNELAGHDIGTNFEVKTNIPGVKNTFFNFTTAGLVYIVPGGYEGIEFYSGYFPAPVVCSIDYLNSSWNIIPSARMSWFIKINPEADTTTRKAVFKDITNHYKGVDVLFADDVILSYKVTPTGAVILVMDTMFFIVLILALFGINLACFQTFKERRAETSLYRSRGMVLGDIRKMIIFELLAIEVLGAVFGIALGSITALTYKDILITPYPPIPVHFFFPWAKILLFLLLLTVSHVLSILGQVYWYSRSSIVSNLSMRD